MDCGRKIAIEDASRKHLACIACAIEFELIHVIAGNEIQTGIFKLFIVTRARERISAVDYFVSMTLAVSNALLLFFFIAAPWREPHAEAETILFCNGA